MSPCRYDARVISPDTAARQVEAAIAAGDEAAYNDALHKLADAVRSAPPDNIQPALVRLAPVLREAPLGSASSLAKLVGVMAGMVTDTSCVLSVLVERACQAMEDAARFLALHREVLGEPPSPEDTSSVQKTTNDFIPAAREHVANPRAFAEAWFAGPNWVQPVLYLSQRADVRAALPQRERLRAAVEPIREQFAVAGWLHGLLFVLDNAPLIVLHRQTGLGFRITIGGIGNNYQLHTLLAARLIGDPDAGWLPGAPPTAAMIAAADGTGDFEPAGGIVGQFHLADPYGAPIQLEGQPAEIPLFDGERIIILDPPSFERTWNAGRVYPLMPPTLRIDSRLSPGEVAARLAKAQPAEPVDPPLSWTDDLTIPLPPGRTIAELVDLVLQAALREAPADEIEQALVNEFSLSNDDAQLACDRAFGGLVRAATRNTANRPAREKDPVAWESFQRGTNDPTLVTRIYPSSPPSSGAQTKPATIVIERDRGGWRDMARGYKIFIDGNHVGTVRRGGRWEMAVPSGAHDVQLRIDWCSSQVLRVHAADGQRALLRCRPGGTARNAPKAVWADTDRYIDLYLEDAD